MSSNRKKICVIGNDPFNDDFIKRIPEATDWDVITVLHHDDVQPQNETIDFDVLYDQAKTQIAALDGGPDAIIGHLDFPVTAMVSLLNRDFGLLGASPEAVGRCEHKYWMREEQRAVFPQRTPAVTPINPFDPEGAMKKTPAFPFWLKPVVGHSSKLGFIVRDAADFDAALHACRLFIHQHGEPFNRFLARLQPDSGCPDDVDGNFAIAEELITAARLFTIEGFVQDGDIRVVGVVESLKGGKEAVSFSRYQYPGDVPSKIVQESCEIVGKLLARIDYDNAPFNVEFFWDEETADLRLLEINARLSKSHTPLFHFVDGATHHKQAIQLALGQKPLMPDGSGASAVAAKFMIRSQEADGVVRGVPSSDEIEDLKKLIPNLEVQVLVAPGMRLSDLPDQDSYSYELADLFIGGPDLGTIEDTYARSRHSLEFLIKPMPEKL